MFMEIGCPLGQRADGVSRAGIDDAADRIVQKNGPVRLALELSENRSVLPDSARGAMGAMIALAVACTIGPALRGLVFVPVAVVSAMALLWLALEWFHRAPVPHETLVIDAAHVRFDDHRGRRVEWPTYWTRLDVVQRTPVDRRLYLRLRDQSVEIGRCIDAYERGQIAPRIADALAGRGHVA